MTLGALYGGGLTLHLDGGRVVARSPGMALVREYPGFRGSGLGEAIDWCRNEFKGDFSPGRAALRRLTLLGRAPSLSRCETAPPSRARDWLIHPSTMRRR